MKNNNEPKLIDIVNSNNFKSLSYQQEKIGDVFRYEDTNEITPISEEEAKRSVNKNKTGNISKRKRDDLLGKIKEIRNYISTSSQDQNTANLLSYLSEIEKDIIDKKYGLIFEEHREEIDEVLKNNVPILSEETDLFIDNGGQMNFLIEGDNLASLKLLEKTHKGKIDVVYIDPPYNTGKRSSDPNSGFMYNDVFVDDNDTFNHSKWLSFISVRLEIARNILSDHGVCFISIDDNELSELRILCNDVFGTDNFIAILPRITKKSGKDHAENVAKNHDYVIVFTKRKELSRFKGIPTAVEDYQFKDKYYNIRGGYKLNQTLDYDSLWWTENMDFPVNLNGEVFYPGGDEKAYTERHKGNHRAKDWVWRWSLDKLKFGYENGFVVIKQGKGRKRIYTKTYANATISNSKPYKIEYKNRETHLSSLALTDNIFSNDNAKKEISKLGLDNFGFPKPTSLIITLLEIVKNSDTVLDFFAGSGTTGHAVMKLNAEDGGNRKFILCTNNENNICRDVTYERIKRVIEKENYQASLKYYTVKYLPISDRMYYEYADELLKYVKELVELENGINFSGNSEIGIVLTDEDLADFISDKDSLSKCKKLYMGHDILPTLEEQQVLKDNDIEVNIIPDYYYSDLEEG